jgi:hypothetical protein
VFVEFVDGALKYHVVDPGKIQVLFEEAIESNGRPRPANRLDIEDATCVVIETGSPDDLTKSYIAIFGRSARYPNGRYVAFRSSGDGREIPEFGDDDSYDWLDGGEVANPLSVYANSKPELDLPEYPIAIIHSGLVRRDRLFPISESLLEEAIEVDVAASKVRSTSVSNARGTKFFSKSDAGGKQSVPESLNGEVILEPGQDLKQVMGDSRAPQVAWELLLEEMISAAQGYTVPDYYVSSKDHTIEAASGVALKVRSGQLVKFRDLRAKLNAPAVAKIFDIEKALISLMADWDESAILLLESCSQTWDHGKQDLPDDDEKQDASIEKMLSLGVYDIIEAIRVKYNLASEAEAIEKYEQLKERRDKYPLLNTSSEEEGVNEESKSVKKPGESGDQNRRSSGDEEATGEA